MATRGRTYASIAIIVCVIGIFLLLFPRLLPGRQSVVQPLAFNHKVHAETAGLGCKDCHVNVETMAVATIPSLELCQTCHTEEPISKSPVEQELIQFVKEKREIPWVQIYSVPDHVYFSHRRHVMIAGLECSRCHGNVASMTTPVERQAVAVVMKNCMNCHKEHKVTNDCLACHR